MKRILMIRTNKVEPDPRVEKEANSLSKVKGLNVEVLAWDRSEKYKCRKDILNLSSKNIPIYRFGIPGSWGKGMRSNLFPAVIFEIKCFFWLLFNARRYDCIHAFDLMTGLPAFIPTKIFKKKLVYDCADYYGDVSESKNISKIFKKIENFIIEKSDITILCTEQRINQILPVKPKKIYYIHNSPDINLLYENKSRTRICKSNSKKLKLVYVGNYCGDRWLIEMLKCVAKMPESIEMHIGGFGALENQIKLFSEKYTNIFIYGKLQYNEVLQLENECDVITALYETHIRNHIYAAPNKFYEALALGKPLLMFKNSGMSDIVEKYEIGAVIEPTFESFKLGLEKIEELLNVSEDTSEKMKTLFAEQYRWEIMERRLIELYETI